MALFYRGGRRMIKPRITMYLHCKTCIEVKGKNIIDHGEKLEGWK